MKTLAAAGEQGLAELVKATHAGMTTDEFEKIGTDWLVLRATLNSNVLKPNSFTSR